MLLQLAHRARLVHRELLDQLDQPGFKALLVLLVRKELQVLKVVPGLKEL